MALVFADDGECGVSHFGWTETSLGGVGHSTTTFDGTFGIGNVNDGHWNKKSLSTTYTELWFSFFMIITGNQGTNLRILKWHTDGTELGSIRWNATSKKLEIYTSTGTLQSTGTAVYTHSAVGGGWFNLNVRVLLHASTGSIEVYADGDPSADVTFSGNTLPSGSNMNNFTIGQWTGGGVGSVFDNFWVNDTSGSTNNGKPGVVRCFTQRPTGDSATNNAFTGSSGGTKALLVDESASDGSDFVYSETTGNKQGFTYAAPSFSGQVKAVVIYDLCRKISSGGLKQGVRISGTDYPSSTKQLKTSYTRDTLLSHLMDVNPNTTTAWSNSDNPESYLEKTA